MTETSDPYRYGYPPPPGKPNGREIIRSSWALLRQDRSLIWLPVLSTLVGLLAAAVLFVPGFAAGRWLGHTDKIGGVVGGVFAGFALAAVSVYFQAALVIGAFMRADGYTPTLGSVLRATWARRRQVFGWAVVSTTVGATVRVLEEQFGGIGKLIGLLTGFAWGVASFFVVPVIVAEGLGPVQGLKRSAGLIRDTWGTSVRTSLRLGAASALAVIPIFVIALAGVVQLALGNVVPGVVTLAVAAIAFVLVVSVFAAITTYARAVIYRYATGRPTPGIAPHLLAGAFTPRRRGRWGRRNR